MQNQNNEKLLKIIVQKLKDGEIILAIQQVIFISQKNKKPTITDTLVITTSCLYFYEGIILRKYFKASAIKHIVMTPYSNQMIIAIKEGKEGNSNEKQHYKQSFLRLQSNVNVRIIKNILEVREKFMGMTNSSDKDSQQKLYINLVKDQTLQIFSEKLENTSKSKSRIYNFLSWGRALDLKQSTSVGSMELLKRGSLECEIFEVSYKKFALQIGQKMYEQIYKNTHLLYINSDQNFRFIEENYECEVFDGLKSMYRLKNTLQQPNSSNSFQKVSKKTNNVNQVSEKQGFQKPSVILMRKIVKRNQRQNQFLISMLTSYKNAEYKQQIQFVIETQTHFEVLSSVNNDQLSLQQILTRQSTTFTERDMRSVFIKLIEMIQSEGHIIFYSLSLQNIRRSHEGGIKISSIFSSIQRNIEIDYISPEEFRIWKSQNIGISLSETDTQLINLWKAGMLIFQMAYGNIPFPIDVILDSFLQQKQQIVLNFPQQIFKTLQFKKFIASILQIDPRKRGGSDSSLCWKQKIMKLQWMRFK